MQIPVRRIVVFLYIVTVILCFIYLANYGKSFYEISVSDRPFHPQYEQLKPSGFIGHGLGIVGSFLIVSGMIIYSIRKRVKRFSEVGRLKYWLDFHIFLCSMGTVMVIFHTTFKFGGLISIGFWSLIIVWLSGFLGRIVYVQIPKSIEGREYTLSELLDQQKNMSKVLAEKYNIEVDDIASLRYSTVTELLKQNKIRIKDVHKVRLLVFKEQILQFRINQLDRFRKIFHYWHIVHLPFAFLMIIIMVVHIAVALYFGYKWVF